MHKASSIALIAFGIFSGQALADDYGPRWGWRHGPGMMMERIGAIDTNDDGVISDDEAADQVESVFAVMDGDDDGELTEEEYISVRMGPGRGFNEARQKAMQDRKKARFTEMDTDKSGKISKAEFLSAGKARFDAADTDKDGRVTPWEFRAQRRG
ncbi:MAG: EF-hand domain-containing protein [Ensifer alkalisoli]|nr:EF-hand domain-containing protein [Sinorhizobium alkalisoli]